MSADPRAIDDLGTAALSMAYATRRFFAAKQAFDDAAKELDAAATAVQDAGEAVARARMQTVTAEQAARIRARVERGELLDDAILAETERTPPP